MSCLCVFVLLMRAWETYGFAASGLDVLRTRFELIFGRVRSDLPTLKSCLIMTGLCSDFFEEPEDERRLATLSILLMLCRVLSSLADASSDFLNCFISFA